MVRTVYESCHRLRGCELLRDRADNVLQVAGHGDISKLAAPALESKHVRHQLRNGF
jgi:hypothetical protein